MASPYNSVISCRPLPVDIERQPPWNRWFYKLLHYWRYGYSHPDEDLLGVVDAVGDALKAHLMSACAEFTGERRVEAQAILAALEEEIARPIPDFSKLLGFEAALNALFPPEMARCRRWVVRERFERVASPNAVQSWRAVQVASQLEKAGRDSDPVAEQKPADSVDNGGAPGDGGAPAPVDAAAAAAAAAPPGGGAGGGGTSGGDGAGGDPPPAPPPASPAQPTPSPPQNEMQGEAQTLLNYIHSNYLMSIAREKAVRDLKRWLLTRFWWFLLFSIFVLGVFAAVLDWADRGQYWGLCLGLALIAIVGRIGASTSVIRRMQAAITGNVLARDPILELTALRTSKNEISLSLATSSVFALLLYAFFLTGVPDQLGFQAGIFPQRAAASQHDSSPATPAQAETQNQPQARPQTPKPPERSTATAPAPAGAGTAASDNQVAAAGNPAAPATGNSMAAAGNRVTAAGTNAAPPAQNAVVAAPAAPPAASETAATGTADAAKREGIKIDCPPGVDCDTFGDLARRLGLAGAEDFFKMLIWAFIAGFAERFVPDALDRVVAGARRNGNGGAPNSAATDTMIAAQLSGMGAPPGPVPPAPPQPPPVRTG